MAALVWLNEDFSTINIRYKHTHNIFGNLLHLQQQPDRIPDTNHRSEAHDGKMEAHSHLPPA